MRSPDPTIEKTRTSGPIVPGQDATWELRVRNVGNAPSQGTVTVSDTLPSTLTIVPPVSSAGWTCAVIGQTVTCTRSDALAVGDSYPVINLRATVDPSATGVVENTAVVSGGGDGNPDNNRDDDNSPATPSADVSITKTAAPSQYLVGDVVTYTLKVRNSGPSTATSVGVTDRLPGNLTLVEVTSTQGTCSGEIVCEIGRLLPGQTATVTVRARAESHAAGTTVTNLATASSREPDPDPTNNEDPEDVPVAPIDLAVSKTATPASPVTGGPISYTIVVRNNGPSPATGVVMRDQIPNEVVGASFTVTDGIATLWPGRRPAPRAPWARLRLLSASEPSWPATTPSRSRASSSSSTRRTNRCRRRSTSSASTSARVARAS